MTIQSVPAKKRYYKCRSCNHVLITNNEWYSEKCPICRGSMRELDSRDKDVAMLIRREKARSDHE